MLRGERVLLRALERSEVELVASWDADPETWRQLSDRPYAPRTTAEVLKEYDEGTALRTDDRHVWFVVDVDGSPVGTLLLWGVDLHNRRAHLGVVIAPGERGKGYATDGMRVLLRYAFRDRGLHRVQLEVLADNAPAIAAYRRVGFVEEGRARDDAWVDGRFVDQIVMSALSTDPGRHPAPS